MVVLLLIHSSKEEFVAAAKTWAKSLNFFLSVDKSEEDRAVLICVRGGRQRDKGEATRAIKCYCPFKGTGQKQQSGRWHAFLTNAIHNHPPTPLLFMKEGSWQRHKKGGA